MKWIETTTVSVITFVIYSVAGMFMLSTATAALFSGYSGYGLAYLAWMLRLVQPLPIESLILEPTYWLTLLLLSLVFGAIAPAVYRWVSHLGRGELDEIRDASVLLEEPESVESQEDNNSDDERQTELPFK